MEINVMLTCKKCDTHEIITVKPANGDVRNLRSAVECAPYHPGLCRTCRSTKSYRAIKATKTTSACNEECREAKTNFCRCVCGGANHGKKAA